MTAHELQVAESPATKDAQTLAQVYIHEGYQGMLSRLRLMVKVRGLTTVERLIVGERARTLLTNNGIIIRRN